MFILKLRTDMNSDAPYQSAVRTSLIKYPFMDEGAGGNRPPHFEKLGWQN
jgi:hypothetical protein